jgi:hypothetical protein
MKITITAGAPIQKGDLVTPGGLPATSPTDSIAGVAFESAATGEPCDVTVSGKVKVRVGAGGAGLVVGQVVAASAADGDGSVEFVDPGTVIGGLALVGDSAFFSGISLETVAAGGEGYINLGPYTGTRQV